MEKKKLGLSDKTKLELSKTVGSGTVKQSFSHGRVKSVAVEVKKVRTFRKNNIGEDVSIEVGKKLDEKILTSTDEDKLLKNNENLDKSDESNFSNQDKLKQLKESAQSERIARENEISSTEKKSKAGELIKENKTPFNHAHNTLKLKIENYSYSIIIESIL